MKHKDVFIGFCLGCFLVTLCVIALKVLNPPVAYASPRIKWEYGIVMADFTQTKQSKLTVAGEQGWEAVAMNDNGVVLVKRSK